MSLITGSPYVVTVTAKLVKDLNIIKTETLTICVADSSTGVSASMPVDQYLLYQIPNP